MHEHTPARPSAAWIVVSSLFFASWVARSHAERARSSSDSESHIDLVLDPRELSIDAAEIERWVDRSARTIAAYFGSFPVTRAQVRIVSVPGSGVQGGTTTAANGGTIHLRLGRDVSKAELDDDWVLVHEMVHLALPSITTGQLWFEEGAATYLEPIARVHSGAMETEDLWSDLMRGAARGLADARRGGLDESRAWGATYWGGALYFLLADVRIRERTDNRRSLRDAWIAIRREGGSIHEAWPIERVIAVADEALGHPVLAGLYEEMALKPPSVDLERLWRDLGLSLARGRVKMDDLAPLAHVRQGVTAPP